VTEGKSKLCCRQYEDTISFWYAKPDSASRARRKDRTGRLLTTGKSPSMHVCMETHVPVVRVALFLNKLAFRISTYIRVDDRSLLQTE
jgi:hypothetical protein